jgi:GNAT superfamily N-acetyltransferase
MDIDVRLATAQDRKAIGQFYAREGKSFQDLSSSASSTPVGATIETMFIVAATQDMVVAALKFDIADDPKVGRIGFLKYFEIEDELEDTNLGARMLEKTIEIAEDKGLKALDSLVPESRPNVIKIFQDSGFKEHCREVYLRREFKGSVF